MRNTTKSNNTFIQIPPPPTEEINNRPYDLLVLELTQASRYLSDKAGKSQDSTEATTSSLLERTSTILSSGDMNAPSLVFRANTGRRPKEEKYLREAYKWNIINDSVKWYDLLSTVVLFSAVIIIIIIVTILVVRSTFLSTRNPFTYSRTCLTISMLIRVSPFFRNLF